MTQYLQKLFTACVGGIKKLGWGNIGIKIDGEYLINLRFLDDNLNMRLLGRSTRNGRRTPQTKALSTTILNSNLPFSLKRTVFSQCVLLVLMFISYTRWLIHGVIYRKDDEEEEEDKDTPSILEFFAAKRKASDNKRVPSAPLKRHFFFTERCLSAVTDF